MVTDELYVPMKNLMVKPGKSVNLKKYDTDYTGNAITKEVGMELLAEGIKKLAEVQDKLYAHNRYRVLIILQAMDAAGKDSAVKHMLTGLNPMGVKVHSFKAPTSHELDHDYLWRHTLALPARGEIAIHNRSHYENVLVTRVHPEYVLNERIPGIDKIKHIDDDFWKKRFKQINRFEKNLYQNGTIILKFFLHLSKKEQKKRLLERIDDPTKNWKFAFGDLKERALWDVYQHAYEQAIAATSQEYAPWFIIPADDKWYTRLAIASIISKKFDELNISYPEVSDDQRAELQKARELLTEDVSGESKKNKAK